MVQKSLKTPLRNVKMAPNSVRMFNFNLTEKNDFLSLGPVLSRSGTFPRLPGTKSLRALKVFRKKIRIFLLGCH